MVIRVGSGTLRSMSRFLLLLLLLLLAATSDDLFPKLKKSLPLGVSLICGGHGIENGNCRMGI